MYPSLIRIRFYPKTIHFFSIQFILTELSSSYFLTSDIFIKISSMASLLMYKMLIKMRLYTDKTQWTQCIKYKMYWWLVYDAAPVGQMPECSTIFETFIDGMPGLWLVKRDMAHRFIVKKHWSVVMTVTGCDVSVDLPNGRSAVPAHVFVDSSKFYKKLGVRTEWKGGTTGGQIGDIKKGALYLVGAPSYNFKVQVSAKFRVYFKSVGNQ